MLAAHLAEDSARFIDGSRHASLTIPADGGQYFRLDHQPGDAGALPAMA